MKQYLQYITEKLRISSTKVSPLHKVMDKYNLKILDESEKYDNCVSAKYNNSLKIKELYSKLSKKGDQFLTQIPEKYNLPKYTYLSFDLKNKTFENFPYLYIGTIIPPDDVDVIFEMVIDSKNDLLYLRYEKESKLEELFDMIFDLVK